MKVLVTGLCTLHWGRLEYGNVGNYYIIEPLFRQLHRVFPEAELLTTFQMTNQFAVRERVTVLPMDLYYAWNDHDLADAMSEYGAAQYYDKNGFLPYTTEYINVVRRCDLVINVSGDMWGDNAEHVGHQRFLVDLLKMRTAQLLKKKTVLFAGTQGPFSDACTSNFAKEVFSHFDLVPQREPMASQNLKQWGFCLDNVREFACPAFLFEASSDEEIESSLKVEGLLPRGKKAIVGFTICGFNMPEAPYDMWPREDTQYDVFAQAIEHIINKLGARVVLISHTNGFNLPPDFELINGRDYPIIKQLQQYVFARGNIRDEHDLTCIEHPHIPSETKAIIRQFDMFVTGRLHASVGAMTQFVPTVFIMHGKPFIRSTKIQGFAKLADMQDFVCEPYDAKQMIEKIDRCFNNRTAVRDKLATTIPAVRKKAEDAFDEIKSLF